MSCRYADELLKNVWRWLCSSQAALSSPVRFFHICFEIMVMLMYFDLQRVKGIDRHPIP